MSHALIPAAKQAVRATDTRAAGRLARAALAAESAAAVRRLLAAARLPPQTSHPPTRKGREMTSQADDTLHILALVGSLRRGSYNRMLYDAAVSSRRRAWSSPRPTSAPCRSTTTTCGWSRTTRRRRAELRAAIAAADGLLIVSPEYNHAVPGVLQNAIDWASRAPDQPFKGKPVAIMGASTGRLGTVRMQHGLRATLESLEAHALLKPEVMITFARESFDDRGLVDEKAREVVAAQLAAFAAWVRRFGAR